MQLSKRMNFGCVIFTVVVLFQSMITVAEFSPLEWNVLSSEHCAGYSNPDLAGVLATLTQMILDNKSAASLPKPYMEIKERLQPAHLDTTQLVTERVEMLLLSTATWTTSTPPSLGADTKWNHERRAGLAVDAY